MGRGLSTTENITIPTSGSGMRGATVRPSDCSRKHGGPIEGQPRIRYSSMSAGLGQREATHIPQSLVMVPNHDDGSRPLATRSKHHHDERARPLPSLKGVPFPSLFAVSAMTDA